MRTQSASAGTVEHTPVLLEESVRALALRDGGVYVDATLGTGGHTRAILERVSNATVIGIDADAEAIETAKARIASSENTTRFFHAYFADIDAVLNEVGVAGADGILADLGVSSFALDTPERGFSFQAEGPLDMRFNTGDESATAADIIRTWSERDLAGLFASLGDEQFARPIARGIVARRSAEFPSTTTQLADLIRESVPPRFRHGRIHPATRVFQALRMKVNEELDQLTKFLEVGLEALNSGGRLAVISFHSGEDRVVKHTFQTMAAAQRGSVVTSKPITSGDQERRENVRSRSAKLRVIEKT
jgi:16S rRNA (cytosine1402-N4)-methyltransferase